MLLSISWNLAAQDTPELILPEGHDRFTHVFFTKPNGKYLVTRSEDGSKKVWDMASGFMVTKFDQEDQEDHFSICEQGGLTLTKYLNDQERLSYDYVLRSLGSKKEINHFNNLLSLRFGPNCDKLVSADIFGRIRLIDFNSGNILTEFQGFSAETSFYDKVDIKLSPNEQYIMFTSKDSVKLWRSEDGAFVSSLIGEPRNIVYAEFSDKPDVFEAIHDYPAPNGSNRINIRRSYDVTTGSLIQDSIAVRYFPELPDEEDAVGHNDFDTFGHLRGSGYEGEESGAVIWDLNTMEIIHYLNIEDYASYTRFSPDGNYLLSVHGDKAYLWNVKNGKLVNDFSGRPIPVDKVGLSARGDYLHLTTLPHEWRDAPIQSKIWNLHNARVFGMSHSRNDYWGEGAISRNGNTGVSVVSEQETVIERYRQELDLDGLYTNTPFMEWKDTDDTVRIWHMPTETLMRSLVITRPEIEPQEYTRQAIITADGSLVATLFYNTISIWETSSGKLLKVISQPPTEEYKLTGFLHSISFSPNGKLLMATSRRETYIWDLQDEKSVLTISEKPESRYNYFQNESFDAVFAADGQTILTRYASMEDDNYVHRSAVYDVHSGDRIHEVANLLFNNNVGSDTYSLKMDLGYQHARLEGVTRRSYDGRYFATSFMDKLYFGDTSELPLQLINEKSVYQVDDIWGWDSRTKSTHSKFCETNLFGSVVFSNTSNMLAATTNEKTVRVFNVETCGYHKFIDSIVIHSGERFGELTPQFQFDCDVNFELVGHSAPVISVEFSADDRYIITGSADGTSIIWHGATGEQIARFAFLEGGEWICILPDGYYTASRNAYEQVAFKLHGEVYSFEQFDVRYNRPDIVLERLGKASPEIVTMFRKAYDKRIGKLGLTEEIFSESFDVPEISITNRDDLPVTTDIRDIELLVTALDKTHLLDHINVWINDVPAYGTNGISLSKEKVNQVGRSFNVTLSPGDNKIQVSAVNQLGGESIKETVYIKYTGEPEPSTLYFIGIGVSAYKDNSYDLTYASKDVLDLSRSLSRKFPDIQSHILTDQDATTKNILELKEVLIQTKIDDQVIISFSGHGLLDDDLNFYLATYNMDFDQPEKKGLPYERIEWLLDGIPARQKLVMIDACHSGEVDKEEIAQNEVKTETSVVNIPPGGRGATAIVRPVKVGMQNSFDLMKERFTDLSRGNGAVVISAAGGMEYAYEDDRWSNGVFTYSVLRGLEELEADENDDGEVTVSELKVFVSEEVQRLTKGRQKPTSRQENLEFDFVVW